MVALLQDPSPCKGIRIQSLNLLTANRLRHYSGGMISDFELLAQKVDALAALTETLRRENAALRTHVTTLTTENGGLQQRMQAAHERVAALLAHLPQPQAAAASEFDPLPQEFA